MIQGYGNPNAQIAIVTDFITPEDAKIGRPLAGVDGRMVSSLLKSMGLNMYNDCYVTAFIKDKVKSWTQYYVDKKQSQPTEAFYDAGRTLVKELQGIRPNIILSLGKHSFRALMDDPDADHGNQRGSLYWIDGLGKVLTTLDPGTIRKQYKWKPILAADLRRCLEESISPELDLPERRLIVEPDLQTTLQFLDRAYDAPYLAFDIETFGANIGKHARYAKDYNYMDCISIAISAEDAICIPFFYLNGRPYWQNLADEALVQRKLSEVLGNPDSRKIAQNAQFDILKLRRYGIYVQNCWFDTMCAAHTLYSQLPKDLGFLSSIYTKEPYFKSDISSDRWTYNAKDSAVTYEIAFKQIQDMKDLNVHDFYFNHVHPTIDKMIQLQERGLCLDLTNKEALDAEYSRLYEECVRKLQFEAGYELNPHSPKQVLEYINTSGLAKLKSSNKKNLEQVFARTQAPILRHILEARQHKTMLSTFIHAAYDPDLRMRASYNITGTYTGRLSSSSSVDGSGINLQNVTGKARSMYTPDPGCTFLAADLSQAEARVVAYLSEDTNMIKVFNSDGDVHTMNAATIFQIPIEDVTKQMRQDGKRITHACLTGDHEVLTDAGWIRLDEYTHGRVAQWDPKDGNVSFTPNVLHHEYKHHGIIHTLEGPSVSAAMTPEHRVPIRPNILSSYVESRTADNLRTGRIPISGVHTGDVQIDELYARILCTAVQEGSSVLPWVRDGVLQWDILRLTESAKWRVLSTIFRASMSSQYVTYTTETKQNAVILQTIAHLIGYSTTFRQSAQKYEVTGHFSSNTLVDECEQKVSEHEGNVYCLTVPTGFFLIRHRDRISVTGNSNYMMSKRLFAMLALIPEKLAQEYLNRYFTAYPQVKEWHKEIAERLKRDKMLVNPFGRKCLFFDRYNDQLIRSAVAYLPQSAIADCMHRATVRLADSLPRGSEIKLSTHDELVCQCIDDPSLVEEVSSLMVSALTAPFEVNGYTISIPSDVIQGSDWSQLK